MKSTDHQLDDLMVGWTNRCATFSTNHYLDSSAHGIDSIAAFKPHNFCTLSRQNAIIEHDIGFHLKLVVLMYIWISFVCDLYLWNL